MAEKIHKDQLVARREPRQARALHKVGLILEASTRLIEKGGIAALTTNAIAERAGVSIGTVYQYFNDKEAIINALIDNEMQGLSERVMAVLAGPAPAVPGGRLRAIVGAVLSTYGGRHEVHRLLLEHALARSPTANGGRLAPLFAGIVRMFSAGGVTGTGRPLSAEEAFVITHAIGGVLRAMVANPEMPLSREGVEDALVRMMTGYISALAGQG